VVDVVGVLDRSDRSDGTHGADVFDGADVSDGTDVSDGADVVGVVDVFEEGDESVRFCASAAWGAWGRSSQVATTGTKVLDSRYEAIIEKPTASDTGTNSPRAAPSMKKDGTNTARMHNMASSRGRAVCELPSRTAQATESVRRN